MNTFALQPVKHESEQQDRGAVCATDFVPAPYSTSRKSLLVCATSRLRDGKQENYVLVVYKDEGGGWPERPSGPVRRTLDGT